MTPQNPIHISQEQWNQINKTVLDLKNRNQLQKTQIEALVHTIDKLIKLSRHPQPQQHSPHGGIH